MYMCVQLSNEQCVITCIILLDSLHVQYLVRHSYYLESPDTLMVKECRTVLIPKLASTLHVVIFNSHYTCISEGPWFNP